jgi:hypothetical protein
MLNKKIEKFIELIENANLDKIIMFYKTRFELSERISMVNTCDACEEYPIHIAVKHNRLDVLEWLLSQGARTDVKNYWGRMPYEIAESKKFPDIIKLINSVEVSRAKRPESKESGNVKKSSLDRANDIIKQANTRIAQLKKQLESQNAEFQKLKTEVENGNRESVNFSDLSNYEILGIKSPEDINRVKKNYKILANIYHPDKCGNDSIMRAINNAYDDINK